MLLYVSFITKFGGGGKKLGGTAPNAPRGYGPVVTVCVKSVAMSAHSMKHIPFCWYASVANIACLFFVCCVSEIPASAGPRRSARESSSDQGVGHAGFELCECTKSAAGFVLP